MKVLMGRMRRKQNGGKKNGECSEDGQIRLLHGCISSKVAIDSNHLSYCRQLISQVFIHNA